jgi:hypothetical protein
MHDLDSIRQMNLQAEQDARVRVLSEEDVRLVDLIHGDVVPEKPRMCQGTEELLVEAARATLRWAAESREHGGNPYCMEHVILARRALGDQS